MFVHLLAQARKGGDYIFDVLLWAGVLVVAVLLLFGVVLLIRKAMTDEGPGVTEPPFALDQLRRLHESGELSDRQYHAMRQQIIAMAGGSIPSPAQPPSSIDEPAAPNHTQDTGDEADSDDFHKPDRSDP